MDLRGIQPGGALHPGSLPHPQTPGHGPLHAELVHPDDLPNVCRSLVLGRYEGVATGPDDAPKLFDERRGGERMTRNLEVRLRHP